MIPGRHILAGFILGHRHRYQLAALAETTPAGQTITVLDPHQLKTSGIRALALDFDGVLAHHGAEVPLEQVQQWLIRAVQVFGAEQIAILSNKPTRARLDWFGLNFPGIRFIAGVRKKPYPDGLIKTAELTGTPLSSILMVDDRLLTGCLAAILSGARPCWINHPFVSYSHRPVAELVFMLLRRTERLLVTGLKRKESDS